MASLRIVDVEKTLAAGRYAGSSVVTVAVTDMLLPDNSVSLTITADGAAPAESSPELHVGVEGLAAVLLGGATWRSLADAGLARADDPAELVE